MHIEKLTSNFVTLITVLVATYVGRQRRGGDPSQSYRTHFSPFVDLSFTIVQDLH